MTHPVYQSTLYFLFRAGAQPELDPAALRKIRGAAKRAKRRCRTRFAAISYAAPMNRPTRESNPSFFRVLGKDSETQLSERFGT